MPRKSSPRPALPEPFAGWFAGRGWAPRPHQFAILEAARERRSTLLIAATGAGKGAAATIGAGASPLAAGSPSRVISSKQSSPAQSKMSSIAVRATVPGTSKVQPR